MKYPRVTAALSSRIWALEPAKLQEVAAFVASLMDGTNSWPRAETESRSRPMVGFDMRDGVAVVSVEGIIERRANMLGSYSGGLSSQQLAETLSGLADDKTVQGVVLDVDSPGGSAMAPEEIGRAVDLVRSRKPVIAWTGGQMCSAAYWIASHADLIMASETAIVGSIGVAVVHYDRSEADAKDGIRRTVIYAGEYKRIASDEKPLSDQGREYIQEQVDRYYALFVEAVAAGRGLSVDDVLPLADGKTYIGTHALDCGMVDRVATFETALEYARGNGVKLMSKKTTAMTTLSEISLEDLTRENPDLVEDIGSRAVARAEEKIRSEAQDCACRAERERVLEILEAGGDPEATLIAVREGTPAAEAYKSFYLAEKEARATARAQMAEALGDGTGAAGLAKSQGSMDFWQTVDNYRKEHGCSKGEAVRAVVAERPELHAEYIAAIAR